MNSLRLSTPLTDEEVSRLRAGDRILLSGIVYTARDAAHQRLAAALAEGTELPFELQGAVIYYVGPCPAPPGAIIGSAGPTTSKRMDPFTPLLLARGLKGMIGKGPRSPEVVAAIQRHRAVYLAAVGGVGALISSYIRSQEIIAYPELGPEAVRRLEIADFPVIVAIDSQGRDLYQTGRLAYRCQSGERGGTYESK